MCIRDRSYTVEYLAYYIASLDSALGTDYGCFDVPGVRETAYFPMYMWGPVKTFSIGDSGAERYDCLLYTSRCV